MKKVLILLCLSSCLISCKKKGCTNPWALNYSHYAEKEDGSCFFEISECDQASNDEDDFEN